MDVVIAGGHGQIWRRLARLLSARGDRVRGLIRNPDHAGDLRLDGAEPVHADLEKEDDLSPHLGGADAVVFAAGAGPGSGPERKRTVDLGAAVKLAEAARAATVPRYVLVSSIGAHDPSSGPESMRPYLEAKAEAEAAVLAGGLDVTIIRPGSLTDEPGTGHVALSTDAGGRGPIPRDDVAALIVACLDNPETIGLTFEAFAGDRELDLALRGLARADS